MVKQKKYFHLAIFALLALAAFFIISLIAARQSWQATTQNSSTATNEFSSSTTDPYLTKASDFYQSFIRDYNPTLGNSPTKMIVFCDLTEEQCASIYQIAKQQISVQTTPIELVWKFFPLPNHSNARLIAAASLCAAEQNTFWPFIDLYFDKYKDADEFDYQLIIAELDLNLNQFETCINSQKPLELIGQDMADSQNLLIDDVPYVLLEDLRIWGEDLQNLEQLMKQFN